MNPVEEQQVIIDELYQIVKASCPSNAVTARCMFDYERAEDGSERVGQAFSYSSNGNNVSAALNRELRQPVFDLVKQLHNKMNQHTGGDWKSFVLEIEESGRVKTTFNYD